jgi:hypothetical protein
MINATADATEKRIQSFAAIHGCPDLTAET